MIKRINVNESNENDRRRRAKLTERAWNNKLASGKDLRDAIDDEDYERVVHCLRACWQEINEKMPEDFDEYDLEDKFVELDPIEEDGYDEDELNYQLSDLYDFCDGYGIWVELN